MNNVKWNTPENKMKAAKETEETWGGKVSHEGNGGVWLNWNQENRVLQMQSRKKKKKTGMGFSGS